MKKIKDLVPKEVRKRINEKVLEIYEDLYACEETINEEMERFEWLWEEEIKVEVKGVKPAVVPPESTGKNYAVHNCGACGEIGVMEDHNYCWWCGARIDWSEENDKT